MYSPREKLRIFNDIPNEGAAVADLNLLQRVAPQHPKLSVYKLNTRRYAGDILFSLLDFSTREEIILNRRAASKAADAPIIEDAGVFASGVGDLSNSPVADAPVDNAPVADAPVAGNPADDAPVDDAPIADAPADDKPVDDAPAKKKPQKPRSTGKSKNTKSTKK